MGKKGWQCSLLPADVVNLLIPYLQWHQPQIYIHFWNRIYEQLLCSYHLLKYTHLFVLLLKKAQFLKEYFEKEKQNIYYCYYFKKSLTWLKGKTLLSLPAPQTNPFFHFICWDSGEFGGLKVSWAGFPTCHKATYGPNRALKHLAEQWASPVDNSVDGNFCLNQDTNKIPGRRDSSQISFSISLIRITTLHCFSTKCFSFLAWNIFVWIGRCALRLKNKGWVGWWSGEIFQMCLKSHFLRNLEEEFCGFFAQEGDFLCLYCRMKARGDYLDIISMCVLLKEKCLSWSLWQKSHTENWSSSSQILSASLLVCLDKVFFHSLGCFAAVFSGFRAVPPASILKDEQSDPFSLLPNSHWLLCH